jgi:hypothetical protein
MIDGTEIEPNRSPSLFDVVLEEPFVWPDSQLLAGCSLDYASAELVIRNPLRHATDPEFLLLLSGQHV